jgi:hypothetical protein
LKIQSQAGGVAQVVESCLASAKPQVQTPVLPKKIVFKKGKENLASQPVDYFFTLLMLSFNNKHFKLH